MLKHTAEFAPVWESLTTFGEFLSQPHYFISDVVSAVIAIILLVSTFVYAWMVMRNFGRGLKDQSTSKFEYTFLMSLTRCLVSRKQASAGTKRAAYPSLSTHPNRMSID